MLKAWILTLIKKERSSSAIACELDFAEDSQEGLSLYPLF